MLCFKGKLTSISKYDVVLMLFKLVIIPVVKSNNSTVFIFSTLVNPTDKHKTIETANCYGNPKYKYKYIYKK